MSSSTSRSATSKGRGLDQRRGDSSSKIVNCPQCGAPVTWDKSSPYRPFCSERCKMIDLGAWATESYRIPIEEDKDTPEGEGSAEP